MLPGFLKKFFKCLTLGNYNKLVNRLTWKRWGRWFCRKIVSHLQLIKYWHFRNVGGSAGIPGCQYLRTWEWDIIINFLGLEWSYPLLISKNSFGFLQALQVQFVRNLSVSARQILMLWDCGWLDLMRLIKELQDPSLEQLWSVVQDYGSLGFLSTFPYWFPPGF